MKFIFYPEIVLSIFIIFSGCVVNPDDNAAGDDSSSDGAHQDGDSPSGIQGKGLLESQIGARGPYSLKIYSEYLSIGGTAAPFNPVTGDKTEDKYNRIQFYRFRADTGELPAKPAVAVLVLIPGFTVGANSLMYTAQSLVRLSSGTVEVWVMDHRHHLIEDQLGMNSAVALKDPMVAIITISKASRS
jgi:hypothetical protein